MLQVLDCVIRVHPLEPVLNFVLFLRVEKITVASQLVLRARVELDSRGDLLFEPHVVQL